MAYSYENKRGVAYYLHTNEVVLKGGRLQRIYYFAKDVRPDNALDELPEGFEVIENTHTGLPLARKVKSGKAPTA